MFFEVFEGIIYQIIRNPEMLMKESEQLYQYIEDIGNIVSNGLQIEFNLFLFSKEIYILQNFLKVYAIIQKQNNDNQTKVNQLKKYIEIIKNGKEIMKDDNIENKINNLKEEYTFLNKELSKSKELPELISFILQNKYKMEKILHEQISQTLSAIKEQKVLIEKINNEIMDLAERFNKSREHKGTLQDAYELLGRKSEMLLQTKKIPPIMWQFLKNICRVQ